MVDEEKLRSKVLNQLEEQDWDMSEEGLEKIAGTIRNHFANLDEARDFVDAQASYLFDRMDEYYS